MPGPGKHLLVIVNGLTYVCCGHAQYVYCPGEDDPVTKHILVLSQNCPTEATVCCHYTVIVLIDGVLQPCLLQQCRT